MPLRTCPSCGEAKPEEDFALNFGARRCRTCVATETAERRSRRSAVSVATHVRQRRAPKLRAKSSSGFASPQLGHVLNGMWRQNTSTRADGAEVTESA